MKKTRGFSTKPDVFKFAVLMVKREMNRVILFQHIPAFLATTPNKHVVGKLLVAPQLPLDQWIDSQHHPPMIPMRCLFSYDHMNLLKYCSKNGKGGTPLNPNK